MTNLDTRKTNETKEARAKSLLYLHDTALSLFDHCNALLNKELSIKNEIRNLVNEIVDSCDTFASLIVNDDSDSLLETARETDTNFNTPATSPTANQETIKKVQALAKELVKQAIDAWAKL